MSDQDTIYVLMDVEEGEFARYTGPVSISAEKLKGHFENLTSVIAKALDACVSPAKDMQLDTIAIEAGFDAEYGVVLVAKAGVKGTITLTYKRKEPSSIS